jgi:hypothetical protein
MLFLNQFQFSIDSKIVEHHACAYKPKNVSGSRKKRTSFQNLGQRKPAQLMQSVCESCEFPSPNAKSAEKMKNASQTS